MRIKLTLILLVCTWFNGAAQKDTLFWFAVPEISASPTFFGGLDRPIYFRISAYGSPSTVTILQPARPAFVPIVVNVPANGSVTVNMTPFIDSLENITPNAVLNFGVKINATQPVAIYYEESSSANPELFTLKGRNALGSDFYIPSQTLLANVNQYNPLGFFSFDMVATEDNTTITITPSKNIVGHAAGIPYSIALNRGQTYSAKATSQAANQHLDGSRVVSDKPIAITIKDDLLNATPVYQSAHDLGGDQIIPTNKLGTEYIAVRGRLRAPYDKVFVLATQNGTTITQDGVLINTVNAGVTQMLNMTSANATYIQSNNPVYVLQLTGHGGEVGIDLLPPINCTGSSQVAYTRSTADSLFMMFLVRNGGQGNFLFNGAPGIINAASFVAVPGTGGQWYSAFQIISPTTLPQNGTAVVTNTTNLFHMGVINGVTGNGARFGYFSDFNSFFVQANSSTPVCPGADLQLYADSAQGAVYSWNGPGAFSSSVQNPTRSNFSIADTGTYSLSVTSNGCVSTSSINVQMFTEHVQPFSIGNDTTYCGNFSRTLSTGNPATVWSTGVTGSQITATTPGTYWATISNLCESFSDTIVLSSSPFPAVPANVTVSPNPICEGGSVTLSADIVNGALATWTTPDAQILNGAQVVRNSVTLPMAGAYSVTQTVNGCTSAPAVSDVLVVEVSSHVTITPLPSGPYCQGQIVQLSASSADSYQWNTNSSNQAISVTADGSDTYTVTVVLGACTSTASFVLQAADTVSPVIATPSILTCSNVDELLSVSSPIPGATFVWSGGTVGNTKLVTSSGTYFVTATDPVNNCNTTASVTVGQNIAEPGVTISQPAVLDCNDTSVVLSASSLTPVTTFSWGGGFNSPTRTVTAPGNYTVVATDPSNGCTSSASVTVNQDIVTPGASIATPADLTCTVASVTLTASSPTVGVTFNWGNGVTTATHAISSPGTYTVVVTNPSNGCASTISVTVNQDTVAPSVSIAIPAILTCTISEVTLTASSVTVGVTYDWGNGRTTNVIGVNSSGTHTVTATDPSNGCTSTVSIFVEQDTVAPDVSIATPALLTCSVPSITLQASSQTANAMFNWGGAANSSTLVVSSAGPYSVTVTDPSNGCTASTSATVIADNSAPTITCQDITISLVNGTATINAEDVFNGSSNSCPLNLSVSPSDFDCSDIGINQVTLTGIDQYGNTATCNATVTVIGQNLSCSATTSQSTIYLGYGVQTTVLSVSVSGTGPFTYSWAPVNGLNCSSCASPVFSPTQEGSYTFTVTVSAAGGCTSVCSVTVCVLDIRYSGNGNGNNSERKVWICHYPPGNTANMQTISVGISGVPAHVPLHGGDRLGRCNQSCGSSKTDESVVTGELISIEEFELLVYPNPFESDFRLSIKATNPEPIGLRIYDMTGRLMFEKPNVEIGLEVSLGADLAKGIYYVEVTQANVSKVVRIAKTE